MSRARRLPAGLPASIALTLLLPAPLAAQSVYADITTPVDTRLGEIVCVLGDVDGDGHAEFAVSTWSSVTVYSGRTCLPLTTLAGVWRGRRAGDIDNDGIQDLLVVVPFSTDVRLLRGGSWNVLHTFSLAGPINALVALGDVDGDGIDDIGIGDQNGNGFVFSGQTKAQIFAGPGPRMCAVGDVTGDGVADFATQQNSATTLRSLVGPAVTVPPVPTVWGASSCAGVGDVDGDMVPDFAVGESYGNPGGQTRAGEVFVYSGATGAMLHRFPGSMANERFGRRLARIGDLNGDGVDELLASTTAYRAIVFDLANGTRLATIPVPGFRFNDLDAGWDITGDGVPDAIIGAPQPATSSPGFARLMSGATLTLQADEVHLPAANGAVVNLTVDMGASHAGVTYLVLGSLTDPVLGFTFGGVHIPLNQDFYFAHLLSNPNTFMSGSLGTLDANGRAQAILNVAPGWVPSALAGTVVHHAAVLLPGTTPLGVTNPMPLTIY